MHGVRSMRSEFLGSTVIQQEDVASSYKDRVLVFTSMSMSMSMEKGEARLQTTSVPLGGWSKKP